MSEGGLFENICFCDVMVHSGVRNAGRTFNRANGRDANGVIFILLGEALFRDDSGRLTRAGAGDLLFIPYGMRYSMEYTAPETHFILVNFGTISECGERVLLFDGIRVIATDDELCRIGKIMTSLEMCGKSRDVSAYLRKK